jgi:hypothetical protein
MNHGYHWEETWEFDQELREFEALANWESLG